MYILHRRDLRRCSGFMMNKPLSRCSKASGESGSTSAPQRPLPALASSCTSPSSTARSSNSTLPKWVSGKGFGKEQPGGNSGKDHYLFTCTFKVLWKSTPQKYWKYWPGFNIPHIQIWFSMHLKNYIVTQNWLSPISRERTCDVQHQGVGGGSFESCGLQGGASGLSKLIVIRGMLGCHVKKHGDECQIPRFSTRTLHCSHYQCHSLQTPSKK